MNANVSHILRPDDIDFDRYMRDTDHSHKVRSAGDYEAAYEEWIGTDPSKHGARLPWPKVADKVRLRPGELSLWAGYSFHGKSLMLGQVILSLLEQHERCCIASFEMKPMLTLDRLAKQATLDRQGVAAERRKFFSWAKSRGLYLYDQQGSVQAEKVLAVIRYCHEKLAIKHFVVDSLMKCVKGEDDLNGQKDFVDALHRIAMDTGMHIHLVAHLRKGQNDEAEKHPPTKQVVRGSGAITDQPDNVFLVWADKERAKDFDAGKFVNPADPDGLLIVDKQRNGTSWFGNVGLWFSPKTGQYVESTGAALHEYV